MVQAQPSSAQGVPDGRRGCWHSHNPQQLCQWAPVPRLEGRFGWGGNSEAAAKSLRHLLRESIGDTFFGRGQAGFRLNGHMGAMGSPFLHP